jgi:hypothetical protein
VVLRIGDDDLGVSKNSVTRAPKPLAEVPIAGDSPVANPAGTDSPEFVIDKIVGLRKANDGKWSY